MARQEYRPDIDGLRAVSVIAVMIFHFFPSSLSGGFTGVDVFFVISGYLVTKSILADLREGKFSIKDFYARRIRRIVPATLPVFIACLNFGLVFMLTEDNSEVGEKVLYSLGMFMNHFLMVKSDYFAGTVELNPLTHFWSLSLEEQFYFFWAPVVLFSFRKNHFRTILTGIFLISLALNLYLINVDPKFTFYGLPTRLWELAAGALLCVYGSRLNFTGLQQNVLSGLALVMLAASFVFFSGEKNNYPGYLGLVPVLSAVFFISSPASVFNRLLSTKVMVTIGLMSYSLYLWHWPLLSFFNTLFPSQLSVTDLFLLLAATFAISWLSYLFVETAAKKLPAFRAARVFLGGMLGVSLLAGLIAASDGKLVLHPQFEKQAEGIEDYDGDVRLTPAFCENSGIKYCLVTDPSKPPTIAVVGDSHASHWFPGLSEYYGARGENVMMLIQERTPPLIGIKTNYKEFSDMTNVFRIVTGTPSIHTVILSAFWSVYANENPVPVGKEFMKVTIRDPHSQEKFQPRVFVSLFLKTIQALFAAGKKVVFVHDVPTTPFLGDKAMPRPFFETAYPICAFEEHSCTFPYQGVKEMQQAYRRPLQRIFSEIPGLKVIDPVPLFCDEGSGLCLSHPNGRMVYSDEHHIGVAGSKYLIPRLFKSVSPNAD